MSRKRKLDGKAEPTGGDSIERELPAELRSFEAALAALSPSADRLDHDLIMFRAGQRHSASPARSLAMPVGLGAMTVLAASLLAMLIARPVIDRVEIIRVPVAEVEETGPTTTLAKATPTADYPRYLSNHPGSRAAKLELVARMLEQDLRPNAGPVSDTARPSEMMSQPEPPVPYLKQLRAMLNDQARAPGPSPPAASGGTV